MKAYEFTDGELGAVQVRVNSRARHIILRPQTAGILITVPPYAEPHEVEAALERFRQSLKKSQLRMEKKRVDWNFRLEAPHFRLSLARGVKEGFFLRQSTGEIQLVCPPNTDFTDERLQEWLHKVVVEGMRKQAKLLLPNRLSQLAALHGLVYHEVKINASQGRWGSCSGKRDINLSLYLMLLPDHLIDYVLLHELTHTVEMNHGERFWQLLDRLTQGKAHALRAELRNYSPRF